MSDRDPLRDAFDDLRRTVLPFIHPPGPAAAGRTVTRRRHTRLAAAMLVIVMGLLGGVVATPAPNSPEPRKHPPLTSSQITSEPAATPGSPATSSFAGGADPPLSATPSPPTAASRGCTTGATVRYTQPPDVTGHFTLAWAPINAAEAQVCAGVIIPAFWATYTVDRTYTETLYTYQRFELSGVDNPTYTGDLDIPSGCDSWYVVLGDQPLQVSITAADHPYLDAYSSRPGPDRPCVFPTLTHHPKD